MHAARACARTVDVALQIASTIDEADELYLAMKAKFAQRPVWSRQALKASLAGSLYITEERLKFRLPQLAYYFAQVCTAVRTFMKAIMNVSSSVVFAGPVAHVLD